MKVILFLLFSVCLGATTASCWMGDEDQSKFWSILALVLHFALLLI